MSVLERHTASYTDSIARPGSLWIHCACGHAEGPWPDEQVAAEKHRAHLDEMAWWDRLGVLSGHSEGWVETRGYAVRSVLLLAQAKRRHGDTDEVLEFEREIARRRKTR